MSPISPMTEEQLEFFAAETARASKKVGRKVLRGAMVGYAILMVGVVAMYYNGQHVSGDERTAIIASGEAAIVDSCNRDFHATERLRGLLKRGQQAVKERRAAGDMTEEQAQFALRFYSNELRKVPLPDCRKVAGSLTDDLDAVTHKPEPLYPGKDG